MYLIPQISYTQVRKFYYSSQWLATLYKNDMRNLISKTNNNFIQSSLISIITVHVAVNSLHIFTQS